MRRTENFASTLGTGLLTSCFVGLPVELDRILIHLQAPFINAHMPRRVAPPRKFYYIFGVAANKVTRRSSIVSAPRFATSATSSMPSWPQRRIALPGQLRLHFSRSGKPGYKFNATSAATSNPFSVFC
ncbi:hypothetical protein C8R43DRAFT_955501 [Mycena crocata]|nr:hypothetical protein C8R43DRAFT_955501 [Mycena crocata]